MSRVTVALVSFIAGISSALLFFMLSGNQTSTLAQAPPGEFIPTNPRFTPLVPDLPAGFSMVGGGMSNAQQPLDGLTCDSCLFTNIDFSYGGGPVRLVNPKFSGRIRLHLVGAAANSVVMVSFLQAILQNQKPPAVTPNAPIIKAATTKDVFIADLVTPYGQTK